MPGPGAPANALRAAGAIAAVFTLFVLAVVAAGGRYGGDEALYTDAALQMVRTGDYVTPRYADGGARFQKPVLGYWLIVGSWQLLGTSYLAARLPFVLALGGVLFLTALLALRLFRSTPAAVAATALLAGNHNVIYAAERAVPDGPLTLFTLVALLGFAGLLFPGPDPGDPRTRRLLAWTGTGLAVATKGLVGALVAGYSLAFALLRRRSTGVPPGRLLGAGSLVVGLALALAWFVAVTVQNGDAALRGFLFDQVGARLGPETGTVMRTFLRHVPAYLLTLASDFLPWSALVVLLAALDRDGLRAHLREHRDAWLFVAGWSVLLVLVFSIGNLTRPRYVLPLYPLLAAALAALLGDLAQGARGAGLLARLATPARVVAFLPGVVLLLGGLRIDGLLAATGLAWIGATLVLVRIARRNWPGPVVAVGLWLLVAMGVYDGPVRVVFSPAPGPDIVAALDREGVAGEGLVAAGVPDRVLAQIHVVSGGRAWPEEIPGDAPPAGARAALVGPAAAPAYAAAGWRLVPAGFEYKPFGTRQILALIRGPDREAVYASRRVDYALALPPGS